MENKEELKQQLEQASKLIDINSSDITSIVEIANEEKKTDEKFNETLTELKEEKQSITDKYTIPKEYIKSVAKGFNRAFIFLGVAGIGKTYLTRQVLAKEEISFVESRGVNSPLALYQFLYENREKDKLIVFDDVSGLINNFNAYSILLSVLWEGIANWNSTTEKLKIPKRFIFEGKIIIIANRLEGQNSEIVKSRCLTYELKMNREDIIEMMREIAKQKHEKLSQEERHKIIEFIETNSDNSVRLDLRTQKKIEQLYLYDKNNWEKLATPLLERDEDYTFLIECLEKNSNVKKAEVEFCKATGKHRATFYRLKKELKESPNATTTL